MKKINLGNKFKFGWKTKAVGVAGTVLILVGLGVQVLKAANAWFELNRFVFKNPVEIIFNKPISVEEREIEVTEVINIIETIPAPEDLETDIEKYIYEVFGIEHYRMAIATFKCESGLREEAFNINTNGTIDVGIAQINSVNFKIEGCSLKEVVHAESNIDCAFRLWDRGDGEEDNGRGNFNAWVGYKNGCAITKYE